MKLIISAFSLMFLSISFSNAQQRELELEPYLVNHVRNASGIEVIEVQVPGSPPPLFRMPLATIPATAVIIDSVPAYDWSFGCSNTTAAMVAGFYDLHGYPDIYTAITNDGLAPMDNVLWGTININGEIRSQCPISATMKGLDERLSRGHVDDYWIRYRHYGPDPYLQNGWNRHTDEDCTGDFMGTNQSVLGNSDGNTRFFFTPDGSPLHDYTGNEPLRRDGCHGLRLFYESRGYQVIENYTQIMLGMYGNVLGFTFEQYMEEIDNQRPVMLQLSGHTMLGLGYDENSVLIFLHDTWDHALHSMAWNGTYAGMSLWGVSVLRLYAENSPPLSGFTLDRDSICAGQSVQFTDTSLFQPVTWLWSFPGGIPSESQEQHPEVIYPSQGAYTVILRTSNAYGYDTEVRHQLVRVDEPCYCQAYGNGSACITEVRFGNITSITSACDQGGYSDFTSLSTGYILQDGQPLLVRVAGDSISQVAVNAWIDWNGNQDFEDPGEEYLLQSPFPGLYTLMIVPPSSGVVPDTRIRIAAGNIATTSCSIGIAGEIEDYRLNLSTQQDFNILEIRLLLDGLLDSACRMNPCMAGLNVVFPSPIADLVSISLADSCSPHSIIYHIDNVPVRVNGYVFLPYPDSIVGRRYYLVVNHRNSIETWSSSPVLMETDTTSFDFSSSKLSACEENLVSRSECFALYAGDINQDGLIDLEDMILLSARLNTLSIYESTDINGDGITEQEDLMMVEDAASGFISVKKPD